MIGRLAGTIIEKHMPYLLLDVNGVGYELQATMNCFAKLPELGKSVVLYTHFVVREDAQSLYGFVDQTERSLFRSLIKVNGVGPKLALTILSSINADQFVYCVNNNDSAALVKLPGVGKKTAERLIIEMRDRLSSWQPTLTLVDNQDNKQHTIAREAIEALVALGYKPQDASRMINNVDSDAQTSEELIRLALKGIAA